MMLMIAVAAMAAPGSSILSFSNGGPLPDDGRPIATSAPYPPNMVDDVRRPGFNGRLWVTRPIIGGMQGPWALDEGVPGPSAYGAFDRQDATVYVRVVHTTIGVSAWDQWNGPGLQHIERARQFWLREQGYTGGVRTFVNDATIWTPREATTEHASLDAKPEKPGRAEDIQPRATIQVPDGMPKRSRIRVEKPATELQAVRIADLPGGGPARISLPPGARGDGVIRAAESADLTRVAAARAD
jgi:hypothetical protein